jgi:hypothetical protein
MTYFLNYVWLHFIFWINIYKGIYLNLTFFQTSFEILGDNVPYFMGKMKESKEILHRVPPPYLAPVSVILYPKQACCCGGKDPISSQEPSLPLGH